MNIKNLRKAILIVFLLLLPGLQTASAYDVRLKIPVSSINNVLNALIDSRHLSYGTIDEGAFVSYYSLKPKSISLNVQAGNTFSFTIVVDAVANFNFVIFDFDLVLSDQSITVNGQVSLQPQGPGFKVKFVPQSIIYNTNNWLRNVINVAATGLVSKMPEISTFINSPLLSNIASQYFTSGTPTLTTTANEVILSLTLLAGPRFVTACNDVNQRMDIGNVQDEEGTNNYVSYPSPKTFEWNIGTTQKLQTPLALLDASNGRNKYRHWLDKDNFVQPEIAPRRIQLTVGTQDAIYKAKFDLAKRVQLSNYLVETQSSGGTVTYESTTAPVIDDYDYSHPTQTHPINTNVPNGTQGLNWAFTGWSDGNMSKSRNIILNNDLNLTATYKAHLRSSSPNALSTNQQRKLSRWKALNFQTHYTILYESGGQIWEVTSTDSHATTWYPERRISTNAGVNKNPSLEVYSPGDFGYSIYVWHASESGAERIYYTHSYPYVGGVPRLIATTTLHPFISPTPVIARRNYGDYQLLTAYTRSNGIDVMKSSDYGDTWIRDTYSDSLNGRYRPSLSSAGGNAVYLAYDNGRRVYFDYYYRYCFGIPGSCIENWSRVLYRGQEEIVPGSVSDREGFRGNAQVVSIGTAYVGVVWEMVEGLYVADALKEEQMEAVVHDERGILIHPTEYSVCFQSRQQQGYPWRPVIKFVGNNYRSPTISYVTGNKLLWMWTNGQNIISTQSTDIGLNWSTPTMLHTGVDPQVAIGAGNLLPQSKYVYRSLSGPIYQVGPPSGTVQNVEETDGATHEMIVADESSDASLSIEMSSLWLKTSANTIKTIPFAVRDDSAFSASVDNVEQYLGVAPYTIPQDADSIYLRIRMGSKRTSSLAQRNVPLRVKVYFTIDGSPKRTAAQWRFTGDNSLNKTFRLSARQLRGKQVQFGISILGLDRNNPDFRASVATVYRCASGISPENKIAVLSQEEVPHTFGLEQNYPNPFNPSTIINYQLSVNSYVTLKVYDILGREVAALVDEHKSAGYYDVSWDASNMPSGVYIYRLSAGTFTSVKKMLLIR